MCGISDVQPSFGLLFKTAAWGALTGVLALAQTTLIHADTQNFLHPNYGSLGAGVVVTTGNVEIVTDQDTIDGEVLSGVATTLDVVDDSGLVPAQIGTSFGVILYITMPTEPVPLLATVTHPPMGPEGRLMQTWPVRTPQLGTAVYIGYTLEEALELVPGNWTFRLYQGPTQIMEHSFEVLPPEG
mmetsp:Transcript_7450/g.12606  ORF Transcript_7450/g.12606 Transcript_7450/m.12606 type:complete len:185 (+) Transcript_7450:447-1001(+)